MSMDRTTETFSMTVPLPLWETIKKNAQEQDAYYELFDIPDIRIQGRVKVHFSFKQEDISIQDVEISLGITLKGKVIVNDDLLQLLLCSKYKETAKEQYYHLLTKISKKLLELG